MVYRMSNLVLNMGIVILTYAISLRLFNKKWVAIIASVLYMTHIAPLHYFRTALTEIPTIFMFLLTIWLFLMALKKDKYRYHVIFGIVAALLLMFRATPAPMLLFAWFIVIGQKGFKEAVKIGFIWCRGTSTRYGAMDVTKFPSIWRALFTFISFRGTATRWCESILLNTTS